MQLVSACKVCGVMSRIITPMVCPSCSSNCQPMVPLKTPRLHSRREELMLHPAGDGQYAAGECLQSLWGHVPHYHSHGMSQLQFS